MNLIAGTPLELKYSLKFILNFKWWTSFEIGQSAAKPRSRKVQRLSKTHIFLKIMEVSRVHL